MSLTLNQIQARYKGQIPTPLFKIAKDLDITIYETDEFSDKQSGSISKEGDSYVIYVNSKHPANRKRFTIAHELAHFLKHRSTLENEREHIDMAKQPITLHREEGKPLTPKERQMEYEANEIAAELLMPREEFEKEWKRAQDVEEVADAFNVSVSAAAVRASKLFGETIM